MAGESFVKQSVSFVSKPESPVSSKASSPNAQRPAVLTRAVSNLAVLPGIQHRPVRKHDKCSEEFKAAHRSVSEQIRRHGRWTINPRVSHWVAYWDAFSFASLFFTAMVTPIEVCLFPTDTTMHTPGMLPLFVCNVVILAFFAIDLVLNFFMCYQEPKSAGGLWVTKPKLIRRHYLRTWFTVDALSVIPFDLLMQTGVIKAQDSASLLRLVRTVRLARLVKLLRLLRTSRIIARWQNYFSLSYAQLSMMKFFGGASFVVHYMACLWAFVGLNWQASEGLTLDWEQAWLVKCMCSHPARALVPPAPRHGASTPLLAMRMRIGL